MSTEAFTLWAKSEMLSFVLCLKVANVWIALSWSSLLVFAVIKNTMFLHSYRGQLVSSIGFARSNAFLPAAEGGFGRRSKAVSRVASCKVNSCSSFSSSSLEVMDLRIPVSFSFDFM